jgi:hypothetical protein
MRSDSSYAIHEPPAQCKAHHTYATLCDDAGAHYCKMSKDGSWPISPGSTSSQHNSRHGVAAACAAATAKHEQHTIVHDITLACTLLVATQMLIRIAVHYHVLYGGYAPAPQADLPHTLKAPDRTQVDTAQAYMLPC